MDYFNDAFRIIGLLVCWGLAIVLGFVVFTTLAGGIIAFASTGFGAIILAIIGWGLWKDYLKKNN